MNRNSNWCIALASLTMLTSAACGSENEAQATAAHQDAGSDSPIDASGDQQDGDAHTDAPIDAPDAQSDGDAAIEERLACIQVCSSSGGGCVPPTVCESSRCVFPPVEQEPCATDNDCVAYGSFWELGTECTTADADCARLGGNGDLLEACIDVDGTGHCVRMPQSATDCEYRSAKDIEWTDIEGNAVTVCGRDSYLCEADVCIPGCTEDADCTSSLRPSCDVAARRCVCSAASCSMANAGSVCLPSGSCGCTTDADCPGPGFDRCYQGSCGCSSTASCEEMLPELAVVCEPLSG